VPALLVASIAGLAGCGATTGSGGAPNSGPSGTSTTSASPSPQSGGAWVTQVEIGGSSTSSGGGTIVDTSEASTSVSAAYRVMAACQGGGSLQITLRPGGAFTVHCTASKQEPARIAGSDSAPAGGILDITVSRQGDVQQSDVLVQVPA
jgi:hypothetical protein